MKLILSVLDGSTFNGCLIPLLVVLILGFVAFSLDQNKGLSKKQIDKKVEKCKEKGHNLIKIKSNSVECLKLR